MANLPQPMDPNLPLFTVTVAARLADMHPQTLRGYERLELVIPSRTKGRARRYTLNDVARLRHIQMLSQEEGINLEGIRRILSLENELERHRQQIEKLTKLLADIATDPATATAGKRIFTASFEGDVALGRVRVHRRAITQR